MAAGLDISDYYFILMRYFVHAAQRLFTQPVELYLSTQVNNGPVSLHPLLLEGIMSSWSIVSPTLGECIQISFTYVYVEASTVVGFHMAPVLVVLHHVPFLLSLPHPFPFSPLLQSCSTPPLLVSCSLPLSLDPLLPHLSPTRYQIPGSVDCSIYIKDFKANIHIVCHSGFSRKTSDR